MGLPLDDASTILECVQHYVRQQPDKCAYTFLANGEDDLCALTYGELDERSNRLAHHLVGLGYTGGVAVLLFPSGLEFIVAFFACLKARVIAVPANFTRTSKHFARLQAIVSDSTAQVVLTTPSLKAIVQAGLESVGLDANHVCVLDESDASHTSSSACVLQQANAADLAFLQYTSGSTGSPKGVMVTHGQLIANERAIRLSADLPEYPEAAGWLPQFHDMGLIGATLQPIVLGGHYAFMSPLHFIQRPLRWLQMIGRFGSIGSGAPNFALDLCVKAADKAVQEDLRGLDLSCLRVILCGAEPVNADVVAQFTKRFATVGLSPGVVRPCYGLAEATLLVSGGDAPGSPALLMLNRDKLSQGGVCESTQSNAFKAVCCGSVAEGHEVAIVDPQRLERVDDASIGEIWVRGPSVASGYWRKRDATFQTFEARLSDGHGPFMRTGDLGFMRGPGLYITGRIKELMIVRGRNYHPNDIEQTIAQVLGSHWGGGACVVFSVTEAAAEKAVVALELARRQHAPCTDEIRGTIASVRHAVTQVHELQLAAVLVLNFGSIPRTSSGKTQRLRCAQMYASGEMDSLQAKIPTSQVAQTHEHEHELSI